MLMKQAPGFGGVSNIHVCPYNNIDNKSWLPQQMHTFITYWGLYKNYCLFKDTKFQATKLSYVIVIWILVTLDFSSYWFC
jgi:hypothetical protein